MWHINRSHPLELIFPPIINLTQELVNVFTRKKHLKVRMYSALKVLIPVQTNSDQEFEYFAYLYQLFDEFHWKTCTICEKKLKV